MHIIPKTLQAQKHHFYYLKWHVSYARRTTQISIRMRRNNEICKKITNDMLKQGQATFISRSYVHTHFARSEVGGDSKRMHSISIVPMHLQCASTASYRRLVTSNKNRLVIHIVELVSMVTIPPLDEE